MDQTASVKYRVLRNRKLPITSRYFSVTTAEAEGLSLEDARALSDRLQREEMAAKPRQTCWTIDIFFIEREDVIKSDVGYKLRKARRKRRKTQAVVPKGKAKGKASQLRLEWR
jgi:hypothetical protein